MEVSHLLLRNWLDIGLSVGGVIAFTSSPVLFSVSLFPLILHFLTIFISTHKFSCFYCSSPLPPSPWGWGQSEQVAVQCLAAYWH